MTLLFTRKLQDTHGGSSPDAEQEQGNDHTLTVVACGLLQPPHGVGGIVTRNSPAVIVVGPHFPAYGKLLNTLGRLFCGFFLAPLGLSTVFRYYSDVIFSQNKVMIDVIIPARD